MNQPQTAQMPQRPHSQTPEKPRPASRAGDPNRYQDMKFAYVMSRFPKISETFVLYEILALMEKGIRVEVFPLIRERQPVAHEGVKQVMPHVHYLPMFSAAILLAHIYFLFRKPLTYLGLLLEMMIGSIRSPKYFTKSVALFPKIVRFAYEMKQLGIGHIHAHFATHPAFAGYVIHKLTGIPYSFTAHGSDIHKHLHRYGLARKVAAADFVRTISDYNKAFIVEHCGGRFEEKIEMIHCGIDKQVFASPPHHPRETHPFTIICVASHEKVKGHAYLIEACRKLKAQGVDFRCHLVGDGPLREAVGQEIRDAGLGDNFIIHGPLKREQVAELLQQSDVKVLPSFQTETGEREGIPVALMEAMAVELPVVSSLVSGIPELVDQDAAGILVAQQDAEGLFQALLRLQRDPELRRRMGKAGREKVFREFDLKENAAELLELLVLSASRSGSH